MNSRYYIIFLLVVLFSSCGNRNERSRANAQYIAGLLYEEEKFVEDLSSIVTVPIYSSTSNHNNNLSAIASDIEFVALSFDPPLSDPFHFRNIELSEDRIFLHIGTSSILSYDRSGKFIRGIGRAGQGPEGIIHINTIQLDRENELLYAADINRQRMVVFRFDGTFERAFPIGGRMSFTLLDSCIIAWRQTIPDRGLNPTPLIEFTTCRGENIKTLWSNHFPLSPSRSKELLGTDAVPLWSHNNNFYYWEFGTDTIFRISDNSLKPVRVLTGDLKLSLFGHFERSSGRRLRIATFIQRPNSSIFESNRFMIFRLRNDREVFFMVYDKKTRELHRTYHRNAPETPRGARRMDFFVDDMFSGLKINPEYQSIGRAIAVFQAFEIYEQRQEILDFIGDNPSERSQQLRQIVQNITDDCNPVLAIITFR